MAFQWSTPTRSIGSRPLDIIPVEIYLKIFDFLESDSIAEREKHLVTLLNLTSVCRFFCSTAFARIFSSINIRYDDLGQDGWANRGSALCRAIHTNKPGSEWLSHLPKEATFIGFRRMADGDNWGRMGLFKMFTSSLKRMPNLQQLNLRYTDLDSRFIRLLCQLPLTHLVLHHCYFPEDTTVESLGGACLSRLTYLSVETVQVGREKDAVIFDSILDLRKLKSLALSSSLALGHVVAAKLTALDNPTVLEGLTLLELPDVVAFLPFLQRFKTLNHLAIPKAYVSSRVPDTENGQYRVAANHLQSLQCPQEFIHLLRPQNQLTSLDIRFFRGKVPYSFMDCFSNCWGKIVKLRLPFYMYAEYPISSMCPILFDLTLEVCATDYGDRLSGATHGWVGRLQFLFAKFKPSTSVTKLTLWETKSPNLGEDGFSKALVTAFPRIREFWTMFDAWSRDDDGLWKGLGMKVDDS